MTTPEQIARLRELMAVATQAGLRIIQDENENYSILEDHDSVYCSMGASDLDAANANFILALVSAAPGLLEAAELGLRSNIKRYEIDLETDCVTELPDISVHKEISDLRAQLAISLEHRKQNVIELEKQLAAVTAERDAARMQVIVERTAKDPVMPELQMDYRLGSAANMAISEAASAKCERDSARQERDDLKAKLAANQQDADEIEEIDQLLIKAGAPQSDEANYAVTLPVEKVRWALAKLAAQKPVKLPMAHGYSDGTPPQRPRPMMYADEVVQAIKTAGGAVVE